MLSIFRAIIFSSALLALAAPAKSATLTFTDSHPDITLATPYVEQGFTFSRGADSGTGVFGVDSYFSMQGSQGFSGVMTHTGGLYDLLSLDVEFVENGPDGSQLMDFTITSNLGHSVNYKSVTPTTTVDLQWLGVTSVTFTILGDGTLGMGVLDNIVVQPVPEPGVFSLLFAGSFFLLRRRKR